MLQSRLEIELYQIVADCIQPALKHVFFVFLCFPLLINATLMLERPLAVRLCGCGGRGPGALLPTRAGEESTASGTPTQETPAQQLLPSLHI